jgi:hypothetical protein
MTKRLLAGLEFTQASQKEQKKKNKEITISTNNLTMPIEGKVFILQM